MKNEKRIPFEIIEKAIVGEPEAIQAVLWRPFQVLCKFKKLI